MRRRDSQFWFAVLLILIGLVAVFTLVAMGDPCEGASNQKQCEVDYPYR